MINVQGNFFQLDTLHTSYVFEVVDDLLIHHYYGKKAMFQDYSHIVGKLTGGAGTAIEYEGKPGMFIDQLDLEYSSFGTGDYKETAILLQNNQQGFYNNFKYESFSILEDHQGTLASSKHPNQVLKMTLVDEPKHLKLELFYKVFEASDVISRYVILTNLSSTKINISRLFSMQLDLPAENYDFVTFDGAWAKERHMTSRHVEVGIYVNDSKCGSSSNRHNPFTILKHKNTGELEGEAYGFNLIYSGNHKTIVEKSINEKIRILSGINDFAFSYELLPNASFTSCEAVISYSNEGLNRLSQQFHHFVNNHIIPQNFANKKRPIALNNWEATYFNFNEKKILELAASAKEVGIELFVLDDGWFGKRNNDQSSLGDWDVNVKKLPHGLRGLSDKIHQMHLQFGLWVEPEMVNEDSDLFRKHPNWAVVHPEYKPSTGRNQLLLDLTNPEVTTYLKTKLAQVFENSNVDYVKWDYNRNITELYGSTLANQGEFYHRYIMGLYDVLHHVTSLFPHVLFEGCASGGNRFDLGMLCFCPQIWTSDDTDYYERLFIQTGTSYGYPLSTISNHVSSIPNHQTLRKSPLDSRFNLACFGVLGYELNLNEIDKETKNQIKSQIAFYKQYRELFQFGTFSRSKSNIFHHNRCGFTVLNQDKELGLYGFFQTLLHPAMSEDIIKINDLDDCFYSFSNFPQTINLLDFGGLINLVSPIVLKVNGKLHRFICKVYHPKTESERYIVHGKAFSCAGVRLSSQFMGTGYNNKVRVIGDFGSRLYFISKITNKHQLKRIRVKA